MACLMRWVERVRKEARERKGMNEVLDRMMYSERLFEDPIKNNGFLSFSSRLSMGLRRAENNLERIELMEKYYREGALMFLDKLVQELQKTEKKSKFIQKKASGYGNMDLAIRCCSLALMFTPMKHDNQYIWLYRDRADYSYKKWDWSSGRIDDWNFISLIKHTQEYNPYKIRIYQYERSTRMLNIEKDHQTPADPPEFQIQRDYRQNVLFKLHMEPNPMIPSAAKSVDIKYDNVKGRILIATQDLKAGTTIIVEDPYVALLKITLGWDLKHCGHCYKECTTLIPCDQCVFVAYCSEQCLSDDLESGHKYECKCLPYIYLIQPPSSIHLGFKALCKTGPEFMHKLYLQSISEYETREDKNEVKKRVRGGFRGVRKPDPEILEYLRKLFSPSSSLEKIPDSNDNKQDVKGFDPETGIYASDSYFQIYNLSSGKYSDEELTARTWASYTLVRLLRQKTNYFDEIDSEDHNDFLLFIASKLLLHGSSSPICGFALWKGKKLERPIKGNSFRRNQFWWRNRYEPRMVDCDDTGLDALYSLASLAGHSCDPNAFRVYLDNGKLALVTRRAIKAGEEITISYCGYEFSTDRLNFRTEMLQEKYSFSCKCPPCTQKWITIYEMIYDKLHYLCPDCSHKFSYTEQCKFNKCELIRKDEETMYCEICDKDFDIYELDLYSDSHCSTLNKAKTLVQEQKYVEAIPKLIKCIEFFQTRVKSPSKPLINSQSLLLSALEAIAGSKPKQISTFEQVLSLL